MSCYVKIKGVPYTKEEFITLMKREGVRHFTPETSLGNRIFKKFDYQSYEDSVMEMMAKLYYEQKNKMKAGELSQGEINALIYTAGAFTDYITQQNIHANTYSGAKITGISANFGKAIAYMLDSVRPVVGKNGEEFDLRDVKVLQNLMRLEKVNSVDDLINYRGYDIVRQNMPSLRKFFGINGHSIKDLTRNERDYTGEDKIEPSSGYAISIFETIDTIINLAIDNSKEQKLFVLGITNSNANAFLSAISLGIPLNDIVRIFKTPVVAELSMESRINQTKISSKRDEVFEKIVKMYSASPENFKSSVEEWLKRDGKSTTAAKLIISNHFQGPDTKTAMKEVLNELTINTAELDDIFVGNLVDTDLRKLISDYTVLNNFGTLADIGEESFAYSQTFSLLRSLPSQKWKMDYLSTKILEYNTFQGASAKRNSIEAAFFQELVQDAKLNDAEYQRLVEAGNTDAAEEYFEEKEKEIKSNKKLYAPQIDKIVSASMINAISRGTMHDVIVSTGKSIFNDCTPLALPHVFAAWSTNVKVNSMLESAFLVHHPIIKEFAAMVNKKIGLFSTYAASIQNELIQENFIRFVTSSLKVTVGNEVIDMSDKGLESNPVSLENTMLVGIDAWAYNTAKKIEDAKRHIALSNNFFLQNLEVRTFDNGVKSLSLTADKTGDPELLERLKEGFEDLAANHANIAHMIFKYAVKIQGLAYDRSNFTLVFPDAYLMGLSSEFDLALAQVFVRNLDGSINYNATKANFDLIMPNFIRQFVRNNPSKLDYYDKAIKPVVTNSYKNYKNDSKELFAGKDVVNGDDVYFDLKFKTPPFVKEYIKRYGNDAFQLIPTTSDSHVYYRKVSVGSGLIYYESTPEMFEERLMTEMLVDPTMNIQDASELRGNTVSYFYNYKKYNKGDIVYYAAAASPYIDKLVEVEITTDGALAGGKYVYHVKKLRTIDLSDKDYARSIRDNIYSKDMAEAGRVVRVSNENAAVKEAKKVNNLAILSGLGEEDGKAINLGLNVTPTDGEDRDKFMVDKLESIRHKLESIPKKLNVIVPSNILEGVKSFYPELAVRVAKLLYEKIGYYDPILEELDIEESSTSDAGIQMDRIIKEDKMVAKRFLDIPAAFDPDSKLFYYSKDKVGLRRFPKVGEIIKVPSSNDSNNYGYVVFRNEERFEFVLFDSATFDNMDEVPGTPEEMIDKIKNPC